MSEHRDAKETDADHRAGRTRPTRRAAGRPRVPHAARRRRACCRASSAPHPDPLQYVMVAVVLVVITAVEIAISYLEGDIPDGLIVTLLLAMAVVKFFLVASWFMHLRTDQPVFRRLLHRSGRSPPSCSTSSCCATLHGVLDRS